MVDTENRGIPSVALRGIVIYPGMVLNFEIGRDASIAAVQESLDGNSEIFLITQRDAKTEFPEQGDLYNIGVVSKILQVKKKDEDTYRVIAEGLYRAKLKDMTRGEDERLFCIVEQCAPENEELNIAEEGHCRVLKDMFRQYAEESKRISPKVLLAADEETSPARLVYLIALNILVRYTDKQAILEMNSIGNRMDMLSIRMQREVEILRIERDVQKQVTSSVDKMQREHYMREQIKALRRMLGEDEDDAQIDEFMEKAGVLPISDESKDKLVKEVFKLSKTPQSSPEYNVIYTYLETVITSLPWGKYTEDNDNLIHARQVLDEDHYGMEKVKRRILEYLAVRRMKNGDTGQILCLVGPPGVGKTSIAKSIARAMERKFVRMSLGGLHDEAEIRGHRRTYIGAIPGRIVTSIRQAGSMNPVFLLDEIDKMASDYKGDPASAMLEVLDPAINSTFADNYLDVEFDLSRVLFLTTANDASQIPRALYDRMEIIELSGYLDTEKLEIAKRHLVPKQLKEHGIDAQVLRIDDSAIIRIIHEYTAESGVRTLEREIGAICRKAVYKMVEKKDAGDNAGQVFIITEAEVPEYLGAPKYIDSGLPKENMTGMAIGLAWTAAGGETMPIEAAVMDGSGKVELTGNLGDVMKESAEAGIGFLRSKADLFKIDPAVFREKDIHIHVPDGAVPKDGPSAGITMATALISAITGRKVRCDTAMTGEITLTGRVLPIGGLREKSLAAYRAGIRRIIVPAQNKKDMENMAPEIMGDTTFIFADKFEDVLKEVLA